MKLPTLAAALSAALLTACATTYKPNGFTGGFSDMPMAQDTYRIKFSGNGFTGATQATEMAMLRAAELTLEKGYSHFVVLTAGDKVDSTNAWVPGVTSTSVYPTGNGGFRAFSTNSGFFMNIRKPEAELIVKMFRDGNSNGLDAQHIAQNLAPKYKRARTPAASQAVPAATSAPAAPAGQAATPSPPSPASNCEACKKIGGG